MITASICTIGDEILIGQITDTNSSVIAGELGKSGIRVVEMVSVGDDGRENAGCRRLFGWNRIFRRGPGTDRAVFIEIHPEIYEFVHYVRQKGHVLQIRQSADIGT